jgi:GntR family transcriptional regulator
MDHQVPEVEPLKSNNLLSKQVYIYLKDLLLKGQFKPGSKFPSEAELSRSLNVSRVSLREALTKLELEGFIQKKHGVGTFVIDRHPSHVEAGIEKLISMSEVIRSRGHIPGTASTTIHAEVSDEELAMRMNLRPGDPVTVITRVRTIDGKPAFLDVNKFPSAYFPPQTPPENIGESLFKFAEQKLGLFISHAVARLLPSKADQTIADQLEIPVDSLLIKLDQVHYLVDNTPIWQSVLLYPESNFSWFIVRTR